MFRSTAWPAPSALLTAFLAMLSLSVSTSPIATASNLADNSELAARQDDVQRISQASTAEVGEATDAAGQRAVTRKTSLQPRQIMAYAGYANDEHLWVQGRVLANKPIRPPHEDDSWWDNLRATYQRWETDEVPGAQVELEYGSQRKMVATDEEGYYTARLERDMQSPRDAAVIARIQTSDGVITGRHVMTLVDSAAQHMVISDMDDTVIHSGITDRLLAARLAFFYNAKTRKPLEGVAALYRALTAGRDNGSRNPIFYVSNSGWNMYDILRDFIALNDIPRGPLLLRDLGNYTKYRDTSNHKAETIRKLMNRFPDLPVVLIGDSGQHDARLYAGIAEEFTERVQGIYIRDIDPDHESAYDARVDAVIEDGSISGVPMLRGQNSAVFAEHMESIGLIVPSAEQEIQGSVERDRERDKITELSANDQQ
jgi:phosphatidate phosphatase APP1